MELNSKIPEGPIAEKWTNYKFDRKLVNPANRRKYDIIVVGTGLAGGAAAATLGEQGYNVKAFTFHDSPRRAHSIAAQGGINAAKNYKGDGDSVYRLFYDTVKGGDFRAREANVYRLAEESVRIIDQMTAQGVPFAREYGGLLDNRSFGGAQVSRTFYARGQTGQQLLLGVYSQLARQVGLGNVALYNRSELVDVVVVDGKAAGIVVRDLLTGQLTSHSAHAVVLATGGYSNAFFLSTNAMACNVTAAWRAHRKGAAFANPCYTQIHPTCIPQSDDFQSKLTLMSESLRNDGRIWCPKDPDETRSARADPRGGPRLLPRAPLPELRQPGPARHRQPRRQGRRRRGQGRRPAQERRLPRLRRRHRAPRRGHHPGALRQPLRDVRAHHRRVAVQAAHAHLPRRPLHDGRALGGLRADDHRPRPVRRRRGQLLRPRRQPPRRLGAHAGPGRRLLRPAQHHQQLPGARSSAPGRSPPTTPSSRPPRWRPRERFDGYLAIGGTRSPDSFHQELGKIMWDYCGMERTKEGLEKALSEIPALHEEFRKDLRVTGSGQSTNQTLEKAGRVDDFFELAQVMCLDALTREESCGGHFRAEHQTDEGEAERDDEHFAEVAAWEWTGDPSNPIRNTEPLTFDNVHLAVRSYK